MALGVIAAASASPVTVVLRPQATVAHAHVELGDIADIADNAAARAALEHAEICKAPRADYIQRLTPAMIDLALRQAGVTAELRWQGAASVQVATRTRVLSGDAIVQLALSTLRQLDPNGNYVFTPSREIGDISIPVRAGGLHVRPVERNALREHTLVWVDVDADGTVYRSVQVPVHVELDRPVLVARSALSAGTAVGLEQFEVRSLNVVGQSYVLADRLPPGARVRLARPVRAGQPLLADGILAVDSVVRGDHVRVVAHEGGIGIEMEGVVVRGGASGQKIEVQVAHSVQPLSGTLLEDRTVAVQ